MPRPRGRRLRPLRPKSGRDEASLKGKGSKYQHTELSSLASVPGACFQGSQGCFSQDDVRLLRLQVPLVLQRGHGRPSGEQVPQGPLQVSVQSAVEAHHRLPAGADASLTSQLIRGVQCVVTAVVCFVGISE